MLIVITAIFSFFLTAIIVGVTRTMTNNKPAAPPASVWLHEGFWHTQPMTPDDPEYVPRADMDAKVAENQRLRDLVRYARHQLHEEGLITDEEFADLLSNTPGAVARLEGYDKTVAKIAALESQLAAAKEENKARHQASINYCAEIGSRGEKIGELMLEVESLRAALAAKARARAEGIEAAIEIAKTVAKGHHAPRPYIVEALEYLAKQQSKAPDRGQEKVKEAK